MSLLSARARRPRPPRLHALSRRHRAVSPQLERLEDRLALSATDGFGSTFETATPVALDATGVGRVAGVLDTPFQPDIFRFTAPFTGPLELRQNAAAGSPLDSVLTVFDATGQVIVGSDDNSGGGLNSLVDISVEAGQSYFVVAGNNNSVGAYELTFEPLVDDFGNTLDAAHPLQPGDAGGAVQDGTIERPLDVDVFRYTAPVTGKFVVTVAAPDGSPLAEVSLQTLDADGNPAAPPPFAPVSNPSVLPVQQGQSYYVTVTGFSPATYRLTIAPVMDDIGDTPDTARTVELPETGTRLTGVTNFPNDSDFFRFTAPFAGAIQLRQAAPADGGTPRAVRFFDGSILSPTFNPGGGFPFLFESSVTFSDDGTGGTISQPLGVRQGTTYYIQVSGSDVRAYDIQVQPFVDDVGNSFATAKPFTVAADGGGTQSATFEYAGDEDFFRFTATASGRFKVALKLTTFTPSSSAALAVYDASLQRIGGDEVVSSFRPLVRVDLQQGQTYYVRAATPSNPFISFDSLQGYQITIEPATALDIGDVALGLVKGNFNGDANTDLAVVNASGGVSLLLGTPQGTLRPPLAVPLRAGYHKLVAADFNGDGVSDLAAVDPSSPELSILFGTEDGRVPDQLAPPIPLPGLPTELIAADVNGDQVMDLVVAYQFFSSMPVPGIQVLLGQGGGRFTARPPIPTADPVFDLVATALGPTRKVAGGNALPGVMDLVANTERPDGSTDVVVFRGKGGGTGDFAQPAVYPTPAFFGSPVLVGDFDGDGIPDLVSVGPVPGPNGAPTTAGFSLLLGQANGSLKPQAPQVLGGLVFVTFALAGDFNNDTVPDFVVLGPTDISSEDEVAEIVLGSGDGRLRPQAIFGGLGEPTAGVTGSFDRGSTLDLLLANADGDLILLPGDGKGGFLPPEPVGLTTPINLGVVPVVVIATTGGTIPPVLPTPTVTPRAETIGVVPVATPVLTAPAVPPNSGFSGGATVAGGESLVGNALILPVDLGFSLQTGFGLLPEWVGFTGQEIAGRLVTGGRLRPAVMAQRGAAVVVVPTFMPVDHGDEPPQAAAAAVPEFVLGSYMVGLNYGFFPRRRPAPPEPPNADSRPFPGFDPEAARAAASVPDAPVLPTEPSASSASESENGVVPRQRGGRFAALTALAVGLVLAVFRPDTGAQAVARARLLPRRGRGQRV
jgi:FG-GAP-like repeat